MNTCWITQLSYATRYMLELVPYIRYFYHSCNRLPSVQCCIGKAQQTAGLAFSELGPLTSLSTKNPVCKVCAQ